MAFKGEIGAEFLDNVKTGFTVGDIYRIIDAGKLGGVDIPFGTFVEWKGTAWEVKKNMQYAVSKTGESLDQAVAEAVGSASDALQEQIDDIAEKAGSGYIPKGPASVATLNGLTGQENGWLYTLTDSGTLTDGTLAVVAGDTVAWDATNSVWYKAMDYAPRQYGTNEVHNLPTTITAFRTGDVIPVDGPDGTAKMTKDNLLKEGAQSALAGNVAPAFDPTRTSENPYKAGESVAYKGKTYTFKVNHYGEWSFSDVEQLTSDSVSVQKKHTLEEIPTATLTQYVGIINSSNLWTGFGKHIAIPVSPGETVSFVARSTTATDCVWTFVTRGYVPSDKTLSQVPFAGEFGRKISPINETVNIIAPSDAAWLIMETIDGGSNKVVFEVSKSFSRESFLRVFGKNELTKSYFMRNVNYTKEYDSYNGVVGSDATGPTLWFNAGKHIAIPVTQGDIIVVRSDSGYNCTFVDSSYVPGDHTSGAVPFASQNCKRTEYNAGEVASLVACADASYLIMPIIDGGGHYITYEIKKSLSKEESEKISSLEQDLFTEVISIDSLTLYKGAIASWGSFFDATDTKHVAMPVEVGDKYIIRTSTNHGGTLAFVTGSYVPGDHTSGAVPFVTGTSRIVVDGNSSVELITPIGAKYLLFVVHDGAHEGCLFNIEKKVGYPPNKGVFQKIRYAHWNIGNFSMGKTNTTTITPEEKANKQLSYRNFINSVCPDILAVCEDNTTFCTDGTLAVDAVYSCFGNKHPGAKSGYQMNSFYSNGFKVLQFSSQSFPQEFSGGYGFSEMLVELCGVIVVVCECHLIWSDYEKRTSQIQFLVDRYSNCDYVIVSGDWNIGEVNGGPSEAEEMQPFVNDGYRMSMMDYMPRESTYSGNDASPALDAALDIICAKGFDVIGAGVNRDCAELSDHRLVYCDLIIRQ